ncbi:hypothetical protein [Mesorhizobium intechi]|uniref:hypothetical protein n=1 Tax=Mesorhizobium intechi TaxID=537601 RepID=UPI00142EED8F|nr:hypothetical protein [Mesorhizobium intechi]
MPRILLAAQVLYTADAGLDPLRRRPLHARGRRPGMLLDALPPPEIRLRPSMISGNGDLDNNRKVAGARAKPRQ